MSSLTESRILFLQAEVFIIDIKQYCDKEVLNYYLFRDQWKNFTWVFFKSLLCLNLSRICYLLVVKANKNLKKSKDF